jgi:hypothetical protein
MALEGVGVIVAEKFLIWAMENAPDLIMAFIKGQPVEIEVRARSTEELDREINAESAQG